ncbi:MAG: hypothetical protein K6E15_05305 [Prevotella sp.]|nr:hypothetical protein [Prevotella sp.]
MMNKKERYDIRRFGARLAVFLLLVAVIIGFSVICLYKAGELYSFSSYIHPLQQDQLFGLGYSYYDKSYKFHMANEVEHPEVLALGSSRIMQVKRSVVSPDYSFYNAGGAIQKAHELPLFINKLQDSPKLILVNIDQWWFNRAYIAEDQPFSPSVYDDEPEWDMSKLGRFICDFYTDLVKGKINLIKVFSSSHIGLNAICNENGFAADGSRYQGDMIIAPEVQEDYNFKNVLGRIRNGNQRFQYGDQADSSMVSVVDDFLNQCVARKIRVVAFLPPFAPYVYRRMQETGKYGYMSKLYDMLRPSFDRHEGCSLYDFTDVTDTGAHNYDFDDGFHGSEIIYNGMIRQVVRQDSTLAPFFVSEQEMDRLDSVYVSKNIRYHSI